MVSLCLNSGSVSCLVKSQGRWLVVVGASPGVTGCGLGGGGRQSSSIIARTRAAVASSQGAAPLPRNYVWVPWVPGALCLESSSRRVETGNHTN